MKVYGIMNTCASSQWHTMVEEASTTATAASAYKTSVGLPKRFHSHRAPLRREFVTEEALLELCDLKNSVSLVMIQPFIITSEESLSIYSLALCKSCLIT